MEVSGQCSECGRTAATRSTMSTRSFKIKHWRRPLPGLTPPVILTPVSGMPGDRSCQAPTLDGSSPIVCDVGSLDPTYTATKGLPCRRGLRSPVHGHHLEDCQQSRHNLCSPYLHLQGLVTSFPSAPSQSPPQTSWNAGIACISRASSR